MTGLENRALGTPTQRLETEDTTKDVNRMSLDELMSFAAERVTEPESVSDT